MDMTKCVSQGWVMLALCAAIPAFASSPFAVTTNTPELTMNQSTPTQMLPVQFHITNHMRTNSGPITISQLPQGVIPDVTPGPATDCRVTGSSGENNIQIASLRSREQCTLRLAVNGTVNLSSTHIIIEPKACAKYGTQCSPLKNPEGRVDVYAIKDFQKVVMILFENEDANVALSFPMFQHIAKAGVYFDHFHAVTRPSQPNYFAMIAGDTFGVDTNGIENLNETTIVDLLETTGRTWKTYAENYPTVNTGSPDWENGCYIAAASSDNQYRRKHNPFMSFTTITNDAARCANIVNAQDHFQNDLLSGDLPDYSFFIPNLVDSGHDLGLSAANTWLETYMFPLMESQQAQDQNILFVLMFDESYPKGTPQEVANNLIYTAFYGPMVNSHQVVTDRYDFYHLLRTMEDIWQLGTLERKDSDVVAITPTVWKR